MKNTRLIVLLILTSFVFTNKSNADHGQRTAQAKTYASLIQYVGKYMYEAAGIELNIYTKEDENESVLYLFVPGEQEIELVESGKHKFSFRAEEGFHLTFSDPENGLFNELTLMQPQGNVKAVRNGKAKIDNLATIDEKLIERGFSGVVLVAQNNEILFNKAYGRKNSHENGLNDINTVFDMGSVTKQFTAAAILKLSMQDKLSVNDKLSKYFDGITEDKKHITIHQLLTHSSGLEAGIGEDYEAITKQEFLNEVFNSDLISPAGEEFNYSNMGYSLLGLIIEKISGKDYETYLNEKIFKPAKIYHTGYVIPEWDNNQVANGFLDGAEDKKPNEQNWSTHGPYLNLKANGGLLTKASDLLLWSQAITNNTVLDSVTTTQYLYPHFRLDNMHTHYGYGWFVENYDTENMSVQHSGGSDLSATDMWIYPNKRITIIILSNTFDLSVSTIARKISNFLMHSQDL